MKQRMSSLRGLPLAARDGPVGRLADLYFHDPLWVIRALAVNGPDAARRVFVPAAAVQRSQPGGVIKVDLTLAEVAAFSHQGYLTARSAHNLAGYGVEASDGIAGRFEDLLVDDVSWSIAGFIFESRVLFLGTLHMVAPAAVRAIDSVHRRVRLRLTRAQIADMPAFETA